MAFTGEAWIRLDAKAEAWVKGIKEAERQLTGLEKAVNLVSDKLQTFGRVSRVAFLAASASITGFLVVASGVEHQMTRIQVVSQASAEEMSRLSETLKDLGGQAEYSSFSMNSISGAMDMLVEKGFDLNKTTAAMPHILNLAAASTMDLGQSTQIAAKLMGSMQLSVDELGHAVDVLVKGSTSADISMGELASALRFVGPVGRTAGKSMEELVATIQAMTEAGISGVQAGTALRFILSRLSSASGVKAMKALGVAVVDTEGKLLPMADIIDNLRRQLSGLNEVERTAKIMEVFGYRAGPAIAALVEEGGESIRKFERALDDAGGTAERIAKGQIEDFRGKLAALKSSSEEAAVGIGTKLIPAFESVIKLIKSFLDWFNKSEGVLQTITAVLLTTTVAFTGMAVAIGVVAKVMTTMLIPVFIKGTTVILGASKAMWAFIASTGPIGIVVVALAALAAILVVVANRHHELNEAVKKTSSALDASRKTWLEYKNVLKETELGMKVANMAFQAQAQMAEGNRLLALSAHGSAADVKEALELMGKETSFWSHKNRKSLEEYAKWEISYGEKRLAAAKKGADQEIAAIKEKDAALKASLEVIKVLSKEEQDLLDEAYGYREGKLAQSLMLLERWYKEQQEIYAKNEEILVALTEVYEGKKKEIKEQYGKETEDAIKEFESEAIGYREGQRAKELHDLDVWYDEQKVKFEANQEALTLLTEIYSGRRAEIERNNLTEFEQRVKSVMESVESSMSTAFEGLADGTKSFKEAMVDFISSITAALTKMAAQMLAQQIMWGGGEAGGGGGLGGLLGGALGGLFGGNSGVVKAQEGGVFTRPTAAIIGEAGPEAVIPLEKLNSQSQPINVNFNVSAIDAQNTYSFILKNKNLISSAIQSSMQGNHPIRRR